MKEPVQPEINIGTVGHVDHGKTTLIQAMTGKWADTHSEELKRGITIRLGYADLTVRKCPKCKGAKAYTNKKECSDHKTKTKPLRKVSFVDAPGHEMLMATMLSGAAMMEGALLLISAAEKCPCPQTKEHLMALNILGIDKIVIVQNKIDLVSKEQAKKNYQQIKEFVKGTVAEGAPIIPVSAQFGTNIPLILKAIQEEITTPERDPKEDPVFIVARSFDVNKPGTKIQELVGGVLGGSLKQGTLKKGDEIEVKPGRKQEDGSYEPLSTEVVSLNTGGEFVKKVVPGGSVGVGTKLDPSITKSDLLAGNVAGIKRKMPPVRDKLLLEVHLMERVVGAKEEVKIKPLEMNEPIMINAWTAKTLGTVTSVRKNEGEMHLKIPVCINKGEKVALSRHFGNRWRLVGYGIIKK